MTICQVCTNETYGDSRTLRISCLYDLSEVSDAFTVVQAKVEGVDRPQNLFCLTICKDCRGNLLGLLRQFIDSGPSTMVEREVEELNPERNIPVRVDGRSIMLTHDEWMRWRATGKPPVR